MQNGAALPPATSSGRVLVVEDEPPLQRLLTAVLKEAGFVVHQAFDGEAAIRLFEAAGGAYDCVVLDLVLPVVAGDEVCRRLRAMRPDVPIVLSSGNVDEALSDPEIRAAVSGVLAKPYEPDALVRAVRAAMESAKSPA